MVPLGTQDPWGVWTRADGGHPHCPLLLGFSLRSKVEASFPRRVTWTRGVDFWLPVNGDKAKTNPLLPFGAHSSDSRPPTTPAGEAEGALGSGSACGCAFGPSTVLEYRHPESDPLLATAPKPELLSQTRGRRTACRVTDGAILASELAPGPCLPRLCSHSGSKSQAGHALVESSLYRRKVVCWVGQCWVLAARPRQVLTAQPCPAQVTKGMSG